MFTSQRPTGSLWPPSSPTRTHHKCWGELLYWLNTFVCSITQIYTLSLPVDHLEHYKPLIFLDGTDSPLFYLSQSTWVTITPVSCRWQVKVNTYARHKCKQRWSRWGAGLSKYLHETFRLYKKPVTAVHVIRACAVCVYVLQASYGHLRITFIPHACSIWACSVRSQYSRLIND